VIGACAVKSGRPPSARRLETQNRSCERTLLHSSKRLPDTRGDGCIIRRVHPALPSGPRHPTLASEQELSRFLKGVERRAFKRTAFTVRDEDAALDIVQDAMIRLAERYGDRPPAEWPLLFQRILANATMDWFRRQKVRQSVVSNLSELEHPTEESGDQDLLEVLGGGEEEGDATTGALQRAQTLRAIEEALAELPARQREAFLLRYWEDFDVAETAQAMGCSEGSVKTHCSRAVHALAAMLRAKGIGL
jgi:RNA polymerase sigma-70 factor (ECF subfamily)